MIVTRCIHTDHSSQPRFAFFLVSFFPFFLAFFPSPLAASPYHAVLFNGSSASSEARLIALTLAGIVNRDSSRLYLLNVYETWSYDQTDERWRDLYRTRGGVEFDSTINILALVDRFRPFLEGAVTYDPSQTFGNFPGQSFRWQGEQAAVIGALTNRLPVSPAFATALNLSVADSVQIIDAFDGDPPVWVTGHLDLPTHPWNNTSLTTEARYLTLLDWGVRTLLPRCNPARFYIREITDWTVHQRMYQVNLAGTDDLDLNSMPTQRADILERLLIHFRGKNPSSVFHIYGWIHPEPMTQWFAAYGASFHETLLANLSWHASFPIATRSYVRPSQIAADSVSLEQKYYLLFVTSEGDASNWQLSFHSGAWLSAARGSLPVAWGWNLHLFRECPFVAAYYFDTATPADGFVSVTSPLGYAYPDSWPTQVLTSATDSTRSLMRQFGVSEIYGYKHYAPGYSTVFRGVTIYNSFDFTRYGQFQSAIQAHLTVVYDPLIATQTPVLNYGPLLFNHVGDGSFYGDASDLTAMSARIVTNIKKQSRPGFLLAGYQRFRQDNFSARISPSSSDISLPRLAQVVQQVKADPQIGQYVEVVTPEKFSILLRKKVGLLSVKPSTTLPGQFELYQNYPNPFNSRTEIQYTVSGARGQGLGASNVKLMVYDILGREVATLVDEKKEPGMHKGTFDATDLASGVYLYRLTVGTHQQTKTMMLLK